jgi:predicted transcriptional regulator
MQNVNVKIPASLIRRLDQEARAQDRTRSYVLRQRLERSYADSAKPSAVLPNQQEASTSE